LSSFNTVRSSLQSGDELGLPLHERLHSGHHPLVGEGQFSQPEVQPLSLRDSAIAERVLALQRAAYAIEAEWIGSTDIPQLHETLDQLQRSNETWVGITEGSNLVAALAYEAGADQLVISRLVVSPAHARHGFGERLVRWVLASRPHDRAVVSTGSANLPALGLYAKLGFNEVVQEEVVPGLTVTHLQRLST
jgi:GNAT superfamily N-acetyltransferase